MRLTISEIMTDKTVNIKCEKGYGESIMRVSGELKALIINSPTKNAIKIISGLGYLIFDSKECEGIQYIPLRVQAIDTTGKRISFSAEEFSLNEKVLIEIRQTMVSEEPTKIIFRT